MAHLHGVDRTQAVLLPEILDDYVRPDNPVRFLEAFVTQLDLRALGFQRAVPAETGRPGYDPGDLLRLYLYRYLHRIRSSGGWSRRPTATWSCCGCGGGSRPTSRRSRIFAGTIPRR